MARQPEYQSKIAFSEAWHHWLHPEHPSGSYDNEAGDDENHLPLTEESSCRRANRTSIGLAAGEELARETPVKLRPAGHACHGRILLHQNRVIDLSIQAEMQSSQLV